MARTLTGTVVSIKADKTATVQVDRRAPHPLYHKSFTTSKKYAVHDEKNELHVGDKITFSETRPISKTKCWKLVQVVEKTQEKQQ